MILKCLFDSIIEACSSSKESFESDSECLRFRAHVLRFFSDAIDIDPAVLRVIASSTRVGHVARRRYVRRDSFSGSQKGIRTGVGEHDVDLTASCTNSNRGVTSQSLSNRRRIV